MFEKLVEIRKNSYSPYTKFPVSAIVVTKDGREFVGVNVEDSSTRAGACAERAAIFSAISNGVKKGEFKEIHVLASKDDNFGTPCFVCRQMLSEMFPVEAKVYCYSNTGKQKEFTIKELCPYPFDEFSEEDVK